jgi:hypothetical protein
MSGSCLKFQLFVGGTLTLSTDGVQTCNESTEFGSTAYSKFDSALGNTIKYAAEGEEGFYGRILIAAQPGMILMDTVVDVNFFLNAFEVKIRTKSCDVA